MIVLPATSMVRAPAGAVSDPRRPTAAMRLSVTRTSPLVDHLVALHRDDAGAGQQHRPRGAARGTSTTTSVFCGSAAVIACRKNCAPQAQVTAVPSAVQSR